MDIAFASKSWKKNWAGGWSLLSCEYLGYQYTRQLKDVLGISLEEALFVVHDGISSCYFIDEHKKAFGKKLADQAIKNPTLIDQWANDLIVKTDTALLLIKKLKTQEISRENFDAYIQAMWDYGVPHRIVKVAVDYLTPEALKSHLPILEKARVHAEPVYEETENYIKYIAEKIGVKEGVHPEFISAMTKPQFLAYLELGVLPDKEDLERQFKGGVLYILEGDSQSYFDEQDVAAVEKILLDSAAVKNLTGQVAYPGNARGRVRIILDPLPEKAFDDGDILVTGMTRPDYLPYIKKSAGFITDAGGILSHAAITARELKKPCIIGTEAGTKLLKDGDIVEINGEKGTVTLIK